MPAASINLDAWCDKWPLSSGYPALTVPFIQGDYLYATDRFCAIRVPVDTHADHPTPPEVAKPYMNSIFSPFAWLLDRPDSKWLPWPDDSGMEISQITCPECDGEKTFSSECPDCLGSGATTCPHCGSETSDCDNCDGIGTIRGGPCEACSATGHVREEYRIKIGDLPIAAPYYRLVAALQNPRFTESVGILYIRFDCERGPQAGQAVVMTIGNS